MDSAEVNNCRLCSSSDLKLRFYARGEKLLKCNDCGFLQVAKKPGKGKLDSIYSESYFTHFKYKDTFTLKKENQRRLKLIKEFIVDEHSKVLDFGCAAGDFISYAKKRFDMWGFDLSDFAVNQARRKNPEIEAKLSSGEFEKENPGYPANFFDGIVLWDVIEHIWDPLKACRKLADCLKPGGYMFVSTPNTSALTAKIAGKYWAFMTPPEHLSFFSRNTIRFLFENKLKLKTCKWFSKGKWTNFGFLLYKIRRIFPYLIPKFVLHIFKYKFFKNIALYIPTGDIQYVVIKKNFKNI
jgi:2-polyprenyl-3-methyl-5-hydroxy-6-metoxy-1,4-benzoquinol methylase